MWYIYHIEHPFFERYKINPDPWPWNSDHEEWMKLLKKSIKLVSFNFLVVFPVALVASYKIDNWEVVQLLDMKNLPDSTTLIFTIIFCMICEDFTFHISHRILHLKAIYPYIHKIHHTHIITVGIAAEYTHPIEFLLGNTLPTMMGPLILGSKMHFFTFMCWGAIRLGETIDGHCGYEFSWSPYRLIPFSASS